MEPVHTTVQDDRAPTMRARSLSLARRLLSGAGRMSLVAYDIAPMVEAAALSHAVTARGELVVACRADDEVPATTWTGGPLRVRVDVTKEAPEWAVRITACAVHLLGELEWLPVETLDDYLFGAGLDPAVTEIAGAVGGRLGVIRTDRVLVHDSAGVLALALGEVIGSHPAGGLPTGPRSFPDADQEWAARDLVGRLSPDQLAGLVQAATGGWDRGVTLSSRAETTCSHAEGQVFCVDVDRTGLTLMAVDVGRTGIHFFAFDTPADTLDALADRLGRLVAVGLRSAH